MEKNLMMVGKIEINNEITGYKLVDVTTDESLDLTKDEIKKGLEDGDFRIPNLTAEGVKQKEDDDKYGIIGKSNAFVVLSKTIYNNATIDGSSFKISDVNGVVKTYIQSDAVKLQNFYNFANAHVNIETGKLWTKDRTIYIATTSSDTERKMKAIAFVKELQNSIISVPEQTIPYANESPKEFTLNAVGRIGRIRINPGTEYFNKKILENLRFDGVSINTNAKYIHASYGYLNPYTGWTGNCRTVTTPCEYEFSIEAISPFNQDYFNKSQYDRSDYMYEVYVRFLGVRVYVLKNSEIGLTRVFEQS